MSRMILCCVVLAACADKQPPPLKKPNTELIAGDFERHPPAGQTAIRFTKDGSFVIAKTRMQFDVTPAIADGSFTVDGDKLTLTAQRGACATPTRDQVGVYKVVISKIGIHFTKVSDACEHRKLDGETWWRIQ